MKNNIKKYLLLLPLIFFIHNSFGQLSSATKELFTADSIKSGNAKDILTSFFQLGLNNLTGPNKEFNFSSNPFAIMLRRNPQLNIDKFYKRNKPLRKLNFDFGVRLDSLFNFNGFTSGVKYSLVDETDASTSRFIFERLKSDELRQERDTLLVELDKYFKDKVIPSGTPNEKKVFAENINKVLQDVPFSKLDPDFQKIVLGLTANKGLDKIETVFVTKGDSSLQQMDIEKFKALKNLIKNKLLWTIGLKDSTYKDKFQFANIALVSELSKGIFDPEPGDNNLEINIKALLDFSNDTLKKSRNLNRNIFSIESGINWVIRDKTTDRSFFEVKFSGCYYHNFANLYENEKKDSLTINGTARFRVYNDIWIPLEIKYDPKNGNIFGFIDVKANFTGLSKLLKGKS